MAAFRLAGLLRLKKMKEDAAAAEMARRTSATRVAQRLESTALQRLGEHVLDTSGGGPAWMAQVAARSSMFSEVEAARALLATRQQEEAEAQREYAAAKQESRALEKLEEKFIEAVRVEEERKEQNVLDELATQRAIKKLGF